MFVENGIVKFCEVSLGKGIVEKIFILLDKFIIGDKIYNIVDLLKYFGVDVNVLLI